MFNNIESKDTMYQLLSRLFPICRSLTGYGVQQTLEILKDIIPIKIKKVPTGTEIFDWIVPKEWNIYDAYIKDENGRKIIDFQNNNLHVVGYSIPVDKYVTLDELQTHLYSIEEQPDAIPYVTSYYKQRWGFCISHNERNKLKQGKYRVCINSELKDGYLTYGEFVIPGKCEKEIFISTYICHPSMANDNLSGPVVCSYLARWISTKLRRFTYRIIFIPETIGSLMYLSKNLSEMKRNIVAGFNITCVGDERVYSFIPSRNSHTLADRAALNILNSKHPDFIKYTYLNRGSDERQYCSPGVDLPVVTLCRSKFGNFPEYHTSLDNLNLVTEKGLHGSYNLLIDIIKLIESNYYYKTNFLGEPQLSKRGLYPDISKKGSVKYVNDMMNFIAYADGFHDLIEISEKIHVPVERLYEIINLLKKNNLIDILN